MASISVTDGTAAGDVVCRLIGLDASYGGTYREAYWTANGEYINWQILDNGISQSTPFTASLSPNTEYLIKCSISHIQGMGDVHLSIYFVTKPGSASPRPGYFYWSNYCHIAVGASANIPAAAWNEFQNNVNAVRQWKGLGQYYFMSANRNAPISAAMFNQLIFAVGDMANWVPPAVSSGTPMRADLFNQIQNALNGVN